MPSQRRPSQSAAARSAAVVLSFAMGTLAHLAAADANTRDAGLRACAAATTKQERHARRCWRYDSLERETWRDYDRAAPRHWREPKDWERR